MFTGRLVSRLVTSLSTHRLCISTQRLVLHQPRRPGNSSSTGLLGRNVWAPPLVNHQQQQQARLITMLAASEADVRGTLRKLLPTVDMDTTTERQVCDNAGLGCTVVSWTQTHQHGHCSVQLRQGMHQEEYTIMCCCCHADPRQAGRGTGCPHGASQEADQGRCVCGVRGGGGNKGYRAQSYITLW